MKVFGMRAVVLGITAVCLSAPAWAADDSTSMDKKFLAESAQGNLFEVNVAKLALQKSHDPNVRKFAEKMVKDHEMLITSMKPFVAKYGVKVESGPSLMDKAKYEELKLKSGVSFDRSYVEAMVKDHNDDLKSFMEEESKTTDPELKAAVAKGQAVILEHTKMIDDIAHMGGIDTPPLPTM